SRALPHGAGAVKVPQPGVARLVRKVAPNEPKPVITGGGAASGDLGVDASACGLERPAVAIRTDREDLRQDRDRRLGGCLRADVESGRPAKALERFLVDARREQPLAAPLLVLAGAERSDVVG